MAEDKNAQPDEADDSKTASLAAVAVADAATPTPTQEELDAVKLGKHHPERDAKGGYVTRQSKAG